jgi:serine/threonine-protein kinase ULK/ATG1
VAELQGDLTAAENGYESALWMLQALLDDIIYDGGSIRDEDRLSVDKR